MTVPHDVLVAPCDDTEEAVRLRDLFFFDMAEAGIDLARRGFITLSLPIDEG